MTLFWTKAFRGMTKKLGSLRWRFDLRTIQLLRAVKANNQADIAWLTRKRNHTMLAAINRKAGKHIHIECAIPNFDKPYAYTDIWDPDYDNFPAFTFIGQNDPASFAEFEVVFTRFLTVTDEATYLSFKNYLHERYGAY